MVMSCCVLVCALCVILLVYTAVFCLCRYGVAFLYGAKLVREEGYSAGQVMNVIFAAIIGGFSLGQAGPNFGTFATGRTAGYRVFSVIDRKPEIDLADEGIVPKTEMQV